MKVGLYTDEWYATFPCEPCDSRWLVEVDDETGRRWLDTLHAFEKTMEEVRLYSISHPHVYPNNNQPKEQQCQTP